MKVASPAKPTGGVDARLGELHVASDDGVQVSRMPGIAGDYRQYYVALRDAIVHGSPAPVTPVQALQVMAMLEWGVQSSLERREVVCTAIEDSMYSQW